MIPTIFAIALLTGPADPDRSVFDAICMVESGGDDYAVGDGGRSRGPAQCGKLAWQDAIEWGGVDWDYDTFVWSREHCRWIFEWYCQRWGAVTAEEKARCWNNGPRWRRKYVKTDGYWRRVRNLMEAVQ